MNQHDSPAFVRMATRGDLQPIQSGLHPLSRGQWIICRSDFGLELAEVLIGTPETIINNGTTGELEDSSAKWVRDATSQDHWLWNQIQSLNRQAVEVCQEFLAKNNSNDTILEILSSIDGKSVVFEFLGDPNDQTNDQLDDLTEVYQSFIRNSEIYKQIEQGCGPNCGNKSQCGSSTDSKSGCGSCSIASRCKKH